MSLPKVNSVINDKDLDNAAMITNELKTCPFCGNEQILTAAIKNENSGNIVYRAWCNDMNCSVMMSVCLGGDETTNQARKEVVEKWNKRK